MVQCSHKLIKATPNLKNNIVRKRSNTMQLYDFILQNDPSLADAEAICRDGAILCESEVTEQPKPTHSRPEGDPINGVQIWYDYAADYYFFEEQEA